MKFKIYPDAAGEWRWNLKSGNGYTLADSGEGYHSKSTCRRMIEHIQDGAADADIEEEKTGA